MKSRILIFLIIISLPFFLIVAFADNIQERSLNISEFLFNDSTETIKSGITTEQSVPKVFTDSSKCKCKCKCKRKRKHNCMDTLTHVNIQQEVPVGENPYLNNPDTASKRIIPEEDK